MPIGSGANTYEWVEGWAKIPDTESSRSGWAHHGVVVSETGDVISYHQGDPRVLIFGQDGHLKESWETSLTEAHGMTLVKEGDTEYIWIADNGAKRQARDNYEPVEGGGKVTGQAVKITLNGRTAIVLDPPPLAIYQEGDYKPTGVAVNEERHGGNGDVWVTDGYAQFQVHRYDKAGNYISSITGKEGDAGAFDQPHAVFVDWRGTEPELYVADRAKGRVQVYDMDGAFKRAFGSGFLTRPSAFATHGDHMIIAELWARLTVLDGNDDFVCYLGANEAVWEVEGWPNNMNKKGELVRTSLLEPGKFNSPHGLAADEDGNLYVAEWLIGGRFTKLLKV